MTAVDDILKHYGVRGMKWGVRNKKNAAASGPKSGDAQQVHDIIQKIAKGGIGAASNADLKVLESRAKLENKYKDIYPKKKTIVDHGGELAKKILLPVFEQQAKAFLNDKAALALKGKEIVEVIELGKHSPGYGRHLKR
jgi:hypothetical protein